MPKCLFRKLPRNERGITGLETAIILIAFVVVASVFAYTVLSAGIFSAEKGKEAVYSGLEGARSSMELIGSVKAIADTATTIHVADATATIAGGFSGNGGTVTIDAIDRKEGTASGEISWADAHNTGLMVFHDLSATPIDMSSHYTVRLWVKSSLALAADDLRVVLDNDSATCASPEEAVSVPALLAGTWTRVQVKMTDPSLLSSVDCVGLFAAADVTGATTLNWDYIEGPGEVDQIIIVIGNALEGEAVDLTTTPDTASPTLGILSDEGANRVHSLVIDYVDQDERVADITWTKIQRGMGDNDDLLEPGEKFEIIVDLRALATLPVERTEFALHLRPRKGSSITIEKRIPGTIDTIMDLN